MENESLKDIYEKSLYFVEISKDIIEENIYNHLYDSLEQLKKEINQEDQSIVNVYRILFLYDVDNAIINLKCNCYNNYLN